MRSVNRLRWAGGASAVAVTLLVGVGASAASAGDPQPPMTMELAREITHSSRPLTTEEVDRFEEA